MTEEKSPLEAMQEFRAILVAARRQAVAAALDLRVANKMTDDPAGGSNRGSDVLRIQEQIDAVDRAIDDETKIARLTYNLE